MDEKPKAAAALVYEPPKDGAPRVVAVGRGKLAQMIENLAKEHGVPVYHHPELAFTLSGLGLDREIPPALYQAVAEIIAWVYNLEQKAAGG
ncbi:MAG TPA: flagellar protein FhlB-like cytoplasmic domain-containing protein [Desulfotomaculum sp.]|nr:flagellar protein FhlB-like cytoplasmic domain-containing protein [Desulfotomaculum sp.]